MSGGVLEVADNANLGAASGGLVLAGGTLRSTTGVTLARNVTVGTGGGTLDTGGNIMAIQGGLGGTGALTKTGPGTLRLAGDNSLTGLTTLAQGEIVLSASNLAALTVAGGARLSGTGAIRGNLANAGTLNPGASPGTLAVTGNDQRVATSMPPEKSLMVQPPIETLEVPRFWISNHSPSSTPMKLGWSSVNTTWALALVIELSIRALAAQAIIRIWRAYPHATLDVERR